ncbi:hypothetical protein FB45DRAFT_267426 [Roridomyces roridus]|uniref:Uncharacterized protein n=1 Tax=Roridomyces roridus TaxID=1738132 RepID=A0AAD7FDC5_9AGAR|nr:hypothetical protein FB45DRAFT_267426 [Roridomyces roridus]
MHARLARRSLPRSMVDITTSRPASCCASRRSICARFPDLLASVIHTCWRLSSSSYPLCRTFADLEEDVEVDVDEEEEEVSVFLLLVLLWMVGRDRIVLPVAVCPCVHQDLTQSFSSSSPPVGYQQHTDPIPFPHQQSRTRPIFQSFKLAWRGVYLKRLLEFPTEDYR